jgi:hypothetical protein
MEGIVMDDLPKRASLDPRGAPGQGDAAAMLPQPDWRTAAAREGVIHLAGKSLWVSRHGVEF